MKEATAISFTSGEPVVDDFEDAKLSCAPQKFRPTLKQPPFPSDNHDATRREPFSTLFGNQWETDAYGRWPETLARFGSGIPGPNDA
jgi:hypothetical protein